MIVRLDPLLHRQTKRQTGKHLHKQTYRQTGKHLDIVVDKVSGTVIQYFS